MPINFSKIGPWGIFMVMEKATFYINEGGETVISYKGEDCAIIYHTYWRADRILDVINYYIYACKGTEEFKIVNIGKMGVRIENYKHDEFIGGLAVWFNDYD